MKLYYDRKSKDPTYFIQMGFRNGTKTSTKNVARIGKHSELLAITDDPLSYAKQKVAEYNEKMKQEQVSSLEMSINFGEKVLASDALVSDSTIKNIGYFFLQAVYQDLAIDRFFKEATIDSKITFDPNLVNQFLTYSRILDPASKRSTLNHLHHYYAQPDIQYQHILRTMDLLTDHYDDYISYLFQQSNKLVKRDTSVCYFDCSNFYFETEYADADYVDEVTGEFIKGFRKYGHSKEHRPNPLVEMGLFMDAQGIPLSMCITSGSDNEQTLAIPEEKKLIDMVGKKKFIYCADAGLGSYSIRKFNEMGGRAFVVTQSIKNLSKPMQEAVFNDFGYRLLITDQPVSIDALKTFDRMNPDNRGLYDAKAYKIIEADKAMDIGLYEEKISQNGKIRKVKSKAVLKQKILITFSRKVMEYQRAVRERQVARAEQMLKTLDPETYKKGPHDVTRFIKRTSKSKSGENVTDVYEIDRSVIEKEEKYDGFYAVATNLDDDPETILQISEQRYKIEDCFRVMKTNFSARPVYHQKPDRIKAHFLICYTALLVFRLLEAKLDAYGKKLHSGATHYTTNNIIETMQNMNVVDINGLYYAAAYKGSQTLNALNGIYDLKLDRKYYHPKDLNKRTKNILPV